MAASGFPHHLGHVGQDRLKVHAARLRDAGAQLARDPGHGQDHELRMHLAFPQQQPGRPFERLRGGL
jgi:hypothetical protein